MNPKLRKAIERYTNHDDRFDGRFGNVAPTQEDARLILDAATKWDAQEFDPWVLREVLINSLVLRDMQEAVATRLVNACFAQARQVYLGLSAEKEVKPCK